jgi:hypothetical protein
MNLPICPDDVGLMAWIITSFETTLCAFAKRSITASLDIRPWADMAMDEE